MLSSRLSSVLQHLARSHRDDASFEERVGVLQASLFFAVQDLPVKRLAAELLHTCKLQLFSKVDCPPTLSDFYVTGRDERANRKIVLECLTG